MAIVSIKKIVPVMLEMPAGELCQRPYHGHPHGCPNHGRAGCPPLAPLWIEHCDIGLATWVFWKRFNLAEQRERMLKLHPDWKKHPRKQECCRYWQKGARKPLKEVLGKWAMPGFFTTICPEAMGINVTETMKQIGVILEWPPDTWSYQVAMGGWIN